MEDDTFQCEECHGIFDIEDSIQQGKKGPLLCELCAPKWIVQHKKHGLWAGNQWTHSIHEATTYTDPDKALIVADSFHLADCTYDRTLARNTVNDTKCTVKNRDTGEVYEAPALVGSKHIFARINWQEVRDR
jgi:hypothetical protein